MDAVVTSSTFLEVKNLVVQRQGVPLGAPVSLTIPSGKIHRIVGGNGSGKTTLLRMLAGLIPTPENTVQTLVPLCFVGHQDFQSRMMTAHETLTFWSQFHGGSSEKAIEAFQLESLLSKRIDQLSQGQRQRLSLARLLCGSFGLWILDEPFANLDQHARTLLESIMEDHCSEGGSIIFSEHESTIQNVSRETFLIHPPT